MSRLDRSAQLELLNLARQTIYSRLSQPGCAVAYLPEQTCLNEPAGAFVTLRRCGKLRGCVGSLLPLKPLFESVAESALAAARDQRFPPVTLPELSGLCIEISVIGDICPVDSIEDIHVGIHGLLITAGAKRGLLLPQVATEHGWDRQTLLDNVCLKAGLEKDAWKVAARLHIFSAQVFRED